MNTPTVHNTRNAPKLPATVRLTAREIQVLARIAAGFSSLETANELYISKRTVDFHLANIYDKLGVNNRVRAYRAAVRLGLIPFHPIA